jgi:exodeoxyribonuclease VII small subunit
MAKRKSLPDNDLVFEEALKKLEIIVQELETGDLLLDDALAKFTEGMNLSNQCLQKLNFAEQQINIILKNQNGKIVERPFEVTGEEEC